MPPSSLCCRAPLLPVPPRSFTPAAAPPSSPHEPAPILLGSRPQPPPPGSGSRPTCSYRGSDGADPAGVVGRRDSPGWVSSASAPMPRTAASAPTLPGAASTPTPRAAASAPHTAGLRLRPHAAGRHLPSPHCRLPPPSPTTSRLPRVSTPCSSLRRDGRPHCIDAPLPRAGSSTPQSASVLSRCCWRAPLQLHRLCFTGKTVRPEEPRGFEDVQLRSPIRFPC
ncbi:WAS/WASL-interacting protein family member 3 isoform X2 [Triticum aestivum]|uniref:WAS/WASL-interacting protein family member 3 isoform X2 n=1 Tax=Triticum aestivum TaxID=4565 RepID=UPI001D016BAC|nr:WAS/WASL-interacting protein family member 3-like isoform X2 [Triticum aestivum]